jgi:hypothetical protein
LFCAAAVLSSSAAVAQAPSSTPETSHIEGATESNVNTRVVCQRIGETGSRLARRRVCMTVAAWAEHERETSGDVRRWQSGSQPTELTSGHAAAAARQSCPRC